MLSTFYPPLSTPSPQPLVEPTTNSGSPPCSHAKNLMEGHSALSLIPGHRQLLESGSIREEPKTLMDIITITEIQQGD